MAEDLFVTVKKTVKSEEHVGITIKEMAVLFPDASGQGTFHLNLASQDENGMWREDVPEVPFHVENNPASSNPAEVYAASSFIEIMMTAVVSDTPQHQALGIAGLTVKEAGKILLKLLLVDPMEAALVEPEPQPEPPPEEGGGDPEPEPEVPDGET